jgi:hypothetical protein
VEERERDSEAAGDAQETRFLPPEPAGPEPQLSDRPPQPPPPPQPTYGYPPPAGGPAQPPGSAQPPPGYGYPPPGYPPPGYGAPPAWGYPPQPRVPDNGQAVAGFVFSLVGVGLLVISFGLSSIVSLGCAITGVICSRNGKRKVDSGETPKHRGLAQAGFIIGWVGIALSVLATAGWILAIALGAIDESSGSDPQGYELSVALLVGS